MRPASASKSSDLTRRGLALTYPAGMANWYAVDFDPRRAGWRQGLQPVGQENGPLVVLTRATQ